jgi:hypothetical protein
MGWREIGDVQLLIDQHIDNASSAGKTTCIRAPEIGRCTCSPKSGDLPGPGCGQLRTVVTG